MYQIFLISGNGLGVCQSSLTEIGDFVPAAPVGAAGIKVYVNLGTGNVTIFDRLLQIPELTGPLNFQFVYNSQVPFEAPASPKDAWHLGVIKKFKSLPTPMKEPYPSTVTLVEEDGHETTYTYNGVNAYYSPPHVGSTLRLYYSEVHKIWLLQDVHKQIVEFYDLDGTLAQRIDQAGRRTKYEYTHGELTAIVSPELNRYEIRREINAISICKVDKSNEEHFLQRYRFDDLGRLSKTEMPDGYFIEYLYSSTLYNNKIRKINQSDGTVIDFCYDSPAFFDTKVTMVYVGGHRYKFSYDQYPKLLVEDALRHPTYVTLNEDKQVIEVLRPNGFGESVKFGFDPYRYAYKNGMLISKTSPGGGQEIFEYYPYFYQLARHIRADGQITEFHYTGNDGSDEQAINPWRPKRRLGRKLAFPVGFKLHSIARYLPGVEEPFTEHFVYDDTSLEGLFLRFKLSANHRVVEYRPDAYYNVASVREYFADFKSGHFPPEAIICMEEMLEFVAAQDPKNVSLVEKLCDAQGQIVREKKYANVDAKGEGISDDFMEDRVTLKNLEGNVETERYQITPQQPVEVTQKFDSLQRLTEHADPLRNITRQAYQSFKTKTTLPNGREELKEFDEAGLNSKITTTAMCPQGAQTRTANFRKDQLGRALVTRDSDGRNTYTFYDQQDRLGFFISQLGIVAETRYDRINRYEFTIKYAKPIDVNELDPEQKYTPSPGSFILYILPKIVDPANDRYSYKFFDKSDRIRFEVDAESYVVEHIYDALNREIAIIRYADKLPQEQLAVLLKGGDIQLKYDATKDRKKQKFYDGDNYLIAEKDPEGYVTEYLRDAGGRVKIKTKYANPSPNVHDLSRLTDEDYRLILSPSTADQNAITNYYYDGRGRCIAEVDPEGHYTKRVFCAQSILVAETTKYATPIQQKGFISGGNDVPPPPPSSPEDLVTKNTYDLFGRPVETRTSNGKVVRTTYDDMGNITQVSTFDANDPKNISPDHQRAALDRFDGFEQCIAEATPRVAQLLTIIDADEKLTPEEKAKKKEAIWQTASARYVFSLSGLKIKFIDPAGNVTTYYYDNDRRHILTIDPNGAAHEDVFNGFGEKPVIRSYAKRIDEAKLAALTGGLITPEVRALVDALKDDKNDIMHIKTFDKRSNVTQKIDAEGYRSEYEWNAFGNCAVERLPIISTIPECEIFHDFTPRGLEKRTTKIGGGLKLVTQRYFDNMYGKETTVIDPAGGRTQKIYERRGLVYEKIDPAGNSSFTIYNAFRQLKQEINALHQVINHEYQQAQRLHIAFYAVSNSKQITQFNIFDEEAALQDSLGNTERFEHDPDGQITAHWDALNNCTRDSYNLLGWRLCTTDANGIKTVFEYNSVRHVLKRIVDADGKKLTKIFTCNTFGHDTAVLDPRGVLTARTFNRRGELLRSVIDAAPSSVAPAPAVGARFPRPPSVTASPALSVIASEAKQSPSALPAAPASPPPLSLLTSFTYNAQKKPTSEMRGDLAAQDQYYETYGCDGIGRQVSKTIDPTTPERKDALNMVIRYVLNAKGETIATYDPKNNVTRKFYNLRSDKRFEVGPTGKIIEWVYDGVGKIQYQRTYQTAVDPKILKDETTLEELQKLVKTDVLDTLIFYFYDDNGLERFKACAVSQGAKNFWTITERRYDQALRETRTIEYATIIHSDDLPTMSTDDLAALMKMQVDPANDRTTYHVFDAASRERFTTDPVGAIVEQRFDALRQVTTTIAYANIIEDPESLSQLPPEQVAAKIKPDPLNDRATYRVFDSCQKLIFLVKPEGQVEKYTYDENLNLLSSCAFHDAIVPAPIYADLVKQLQALQPDPKKDRISSFQYDNANRKIADVDALGHADKYKLDALDNRIGHEDRNGEVWESGFNRALLLVSETTPSVSVTSIGLSGDKLGVTKREVIPIERKTQRDDAGNVISITEAAGTPEARTIKFDHDAANELQKTLVEGVVVDDPVKSASFSDRPVQIVPLTTFIIRDGKHLKVAEKNQGDQWKFFVHDALEREVYTVDALGGVIKTEYNAFNQPETTTAFATPLGIDLSKFTGTGIPLAVVEANLKPSSDDRITMNFYNRCGDPTLEKKGPLLYFPPQSATPVAASPSPSVIASEAKQSHEAVVGARSPRPSGIAPEVQFAMTRKEYNAFRDCVKKSRLVKPNVWAEEVYWMNRCGFQVAECNAVRNVIRQMINVYGEIETKREFATALLQMPDPSMPLADLDKAIVVSVNDRTYRFEHDLVGQLLAEIRAGVIVQELRLGAGNVPYFIDLPPQDLAKRYQWSPTQVCFAVTYEDGNTEYFYHDARGFLIANTQVPRQSQDEGMVIPLTFHFANVHKQEVETVRYKRGAVSAGPGKVPDPKDPGNPENQVDLALWDNRGLASFKQDAEGHNTGYTYTANRKTARSFYELSTLRQVQTSSPAAVVGAQVKEPSDVTVGARFPRPSGAIASPTPSAIASPTPSVLARSFAPKQSPRPLDDEKQIACVSQKPQLLAMTGNSVPASANPRFTYTPVVNIDERRFTFDGLNRAIRTGVWRNGTELEVFAQAYNVFSDAIAEGPEIGNWPIYRRYDNVGNTWSTNAEGGVATLFLRDLSGNEVMRLQSPTDDLSNVAYASIGDILAWDVKRLERTESQRDLENRIIVRTTPAGYQNDPSQTLDLPLKIIAGHYYYQLGCTSLSWVEPQERITQPHFYIWPQGSPDQKRELTIQTLNGRCGVDVSEFFSDVYEYQINYNRQDGSIAYCTKGTLQFETGKNEASRRLVAVIEDECTLWLTGNTKGLAAVELWQDEQKIDRLPVTFDPQKQKYFADLSKYKSGIYQVKPLTTNSKEQPLSLPFTVHTELLPAKPMSREISCDMQVLTLGTHGQVIWEVPPAWQKAPVYFDCDYWADDGSEEGSHKHHSDMILPDTDKGHYTDDQGRTLICNTEFPFPVLGVMSASLSIQVGSAKDDRLILQNKVTPLIPEESPQKSDEHECSCKQHDQAANSTASSSTSVIARSEATKQSPRLLEEERHAVGARFPRPFGVIANPEATVVAPLVGAQRRAGTRPAPTGLTGAIASPSTSVIASEAKQSHEDREPPKLIAGYDFATTQTLFIAPFEGLKPAELPAIEYLDTTLDRLAIWKQLTATSVTTKGFGLDVTNLPPAYYPAKLAGTEFALAIALDSGNMVFSSTPIPPPKPILIQPVRYYAHDAWNNVIWEKDSVGAETSSTYNWRNQPLTCIEPLVNVANEDGSVVKLCPVTRSGYSVRGYNIGTCDPNGHTTASIYDTAGQELQHFLGDGTCSRTQIFDALSRMVKYADARGYWWVREFNHLNKIVHLAMPSGKNCYYGYNERSKRTIDVNPAGYANRYNYDARDNIVESYVPLGQRTGMAWDRNHQETAVSNPDGTALIWQRDYFSTVLGHTDLGGGGYGHAYDFKRQLVHRWSAGGAHGSYMDEYFNVVPMPNQDLYFDYTFGHITRVEDRAHSKITLYDNDTEGRRLAAQLFGHGALKRKIQTLVDSHGRECWTSDGTMEVYTNFDAANNRRDIWATLYLERGKKEEHHPRYKYDAANRIIVNAGVLKDGAIVIDAGKGMEIVYANNFRVSERETPYKGADTIRSLQYDPDGLLVIINNNYGRHIEKTYHPAGWLQHYREVYGESKTAYDISCDENGWQLSEYHNDEWYDKLDKKHHQSISNTSYSNFSAVGLPRHQRTDYNTDGEGVWDEMDMGYVAYDGYQLSYIGGTRGDKHGTSPYASGSEYYDANGLPSGKYVWMKVGVCDEWVLKPYPYCKKWHDEYHSVPTTFDTTYDGLVMRRRGQANSCSLFSVNGTYLAGYRPKERVSCLVEELPSITVEQPASSAAFKSHATSSTESRGHTTSSAATIEKSTGSTATRAQATSSADRGQATKSSSPLMKLPSPSVLSPSALEEHHHDSHSEYHREQSDRRGAVPAPFRHHHEIQPEHHHESHLPCHCEELRSEAISSASRTPKTDCIKDLLSPYVDSSRKDEREEAAKEHKAIQSSQPSASQQQSQQIQQQPQRSLVSKSKVCGHYEDGDEEKTVFPPFSPFPDDRAHLIDYIYSVENMPPTPPTYVVCTGDTFARISEKMYGNEHYASIIAEFNGMSDQEPQPGQTIKIPEIIAANNDAKCCRPYTQFMQAIIGSIYPDIKAPQPPPPKKQHHGGFFSILVEAVVLVVACIVAQPLASFLIAHMIVGGLALTATGGLFAAGSAGLAVVSGVTAGLLDAAGQGIAVGLGIEDKFSVSDVIGATVMTGFNVYGAAPEGVASGAKGVAKGVAAGAEKSAEMSTAKIAAAAFKQGVAAATSQLIGLATGAISKFDIESIATAMATQAIDLKMNIPDTANGFFKDSMSTLNQVAINAAARGRLPDNLEELAAQYLGTEIGKYAVKGVGYMIENHAQSEQQKAHPEAGQDASNRGPVSDSAKAKKQTAETQDAAKTKSAADQKSASARDGTDDAAASGSSGQARKEQASKAAKDKESDAHKTSSSNNSRKGAAATKSGHSAHSPSDSADYIPMPDMQDPNKAVAEALQAGIYTADIPSDFKQAADSTFFGSSGRTPRSATTATPTPSSVTTEPGARGAMVKAETGQSSLSTIFQQEISSTKNWLQTSFVTDSKYFMANAPQYSVMRDFYWNRAMAAVERIKFLESNFTTIAGAQEIQSLKAIEKQSIQLASSYATKFSFFKVTNFAAAAAALPVDLALGAYNVVSAQPGTRMRSAYGEAGKIIGGTFGGVVGFGEGFAEGALPFAEVPLAAAVSGAIVGTAKAVVSGAIGAAAGKMAFESFYDEIVTPSAERLSKHFQSP